MAELTFLAIASAKITHYLLDINHPQGGSKAKFLISRGFSPSKPSELARPTTTVRGGSISPRSRPTPR
ncbi:DUF6883 domain-containing protein [Enterovirga aerilata]|uniref:DUF6883 domain-containing protein n=1 Tax=Enterovirga aerilata TaxID=2730920 RepID=UPI003D2DF39F